MSVRLEPQRGEMENNLQTQPFGHCSPFQVFDLPVELTLLFD